MEQYVSSWTYGPELLLESDISFLIIKHFHMKIKQVGYEFNNVFCLNVSMHNNRLIACMQDEDCNLLVVQCDRIEQMINMSIVFDESVEIITEEWLEYWEV